MLRTSFSILLYLTASLFAQTTYVFLGSYNRESNTPGIYVYALDTISGKLMKVSSDSSIKNPSFLALSENGKSLYACTETQTKNQGSVSSFKFDPDSGQLTFLNKQSSGGENPVYITLSGNGKQLICGNYTEGSVSVFPILQNGSISPFTQIFKYKQGSHSTARQDCSRIHATVLSPDKKYVFATDFGADKIRRYKYDSSNTKSLKEDTSFNCVLGSGPRHLIFHPNGKFAYCINELRGSVTVYAYSDGRLDSLQRVLTHVNDYIGFVMSADIHFSPDGKFLYTSDRANQNCITIFTVSENGFLEFIEFQSTHGIHPRIFDISADGKFLIVGNMVTGNVVVFKRNMQTGKLETSDEIKNIANVSYVLIREY